MDIFIICKDVKILPEILVSDLVTEICGSVWTFGYSSFDQIKWMNDINK